MVWGAWQSVSICINLVSHLLRKPLMQVHNRPVHMMQPDSHELIRASLMCRGFGEETEGLTASLVSVHTTLSALFPHLAEALSLRAILSVVVLASSLRYYTPSGLDLFCWILTSQQEYSCFTNQGSHSSYAGSPSTHV